MDSIPKQPAKALTLEAHGVGPARYDVALEPSQAWCLKGLHGEPDEIVIPGLLLDDLGNCSPVEAGMGVALFHLMLAMVTLEENLMLTARHAAEPRRTRSEANVWTVEGRLDPRRLALEAVVALDRVVVDAYGTHCIDTLRAAQILPGPKAWR